MHLTTTTVWQRNWDAINALTAEGKRRYKYIINKGSSRSSKTRSLIDCCDLYARSNDSKRITIWRETKVSCVDTILNDMQRAYRETARQNLGYTFNKTKSFFSYSTKSDIEIHGADEIDKVHGLQQNVAWLNEPYKISRDVFDQIDQRTSDFILIDLNPKQKHWIDDIMLDPRAIVIPSTFRDNPFCPPEQRQKILSYQPVAASALVTEKLLDTATAMFYDTEKNPLGFSVKHIRELARCQHNERKKSANLFNWQVYGLGISGERPHRIFNWQKIPTAEYRTLDVTEYFGVDWGKVDSFGIVGVKYYDGMLYLHQYNYASENELMNTLTPAQHREIRQHEEGLVLWLFQRIGIPEDGYIICDDNRPKKILALRNAGWEYAVAAEKGPDSILNGIDLLTGMDVCFTDESPDLEAEQEAYSRKTDRYGVVLEEPEDLNNHLIDPVRYVANFLRAEGIIKNI